jgi:hypothetical protein
VEKKAFRETIESHNPQTEPTMDQCIDEALENLDKDEDGGIIARMMAREHAASQNDGAQLAAGVESVGDKCTAELNKYLSTEPLLHYS